MYLVSGKIFFFLLALLGNLLARAAVLEHVCLENEKPVPLPNEANQVVLQSEEPHIPFTGNGLVSSQHLIELVNRTFLDPLPSQLVADPHLDGVVGDLWWKGKAQLLTDVFQVDIRVPWMGSCRPVVTGVKQLHEGIVCHKNTCSVTVRVTVAQNYQTTESLRVETTLYAGASYRGVEASITTTRERFWEKIWSQGSESSVEYTWNLEAGQACVPSMAHVELECDVDYYTVHYDTRYRRPQDRTSLEYTQNRKAPWNGNQWCYTQPVEETPLRRENDWHEVLPNDGHRGNRGNLWKFPARQMNKYRLPNPGGGSFNSDQIVLSRQRGSGGTWNELFRCTRNPATRKAGRITVPLSAESGALRGFVACVSR